MPAIPQKCDGCGLWKPCRCCVECGATILHPHVSGCSLITAEPPCRACGGTGVNSKGGMCSPCFYNGRIVFKQEQPKPAHRGPVVLGSKAKEVKF